MRRHGPPRVSPTPRGWDRLERKPEATRLASYRRRRRGQRAHQTGRHGARVAVPGIDPHDGGEPCNRRESATPSLTVDRYISRARPDRAARTDAPPINMVGVCAVSARFTQEWRSVSSATLSRVELARWGSHLAAAAAAYFSLI